MVVNGSCIQEPKTDPCAGKPYLYVTNASCTNNCGEGFYLNITTKFCWPCYAGCKICTDSSTNGSNCKLCE